MQRLPPADTSKNEESRNVMRASEIMTKGVVSDVEKNKNKMISLNVFTWEVLSATSAVL